MTSLLAKPIKRVFRVDMLPTDKRRADKLGYYVHFVDQEAADDFVARAVAADRLLRGENAKQHVTFTITSIPIKSKGENPKWD